MVELCTSFKMCHIRIMYVTLNHINKNIYYTISNRFRFPTIRNTKSRELGDKQKALQSTLHYCRKLKNKATAFCALYV